MPDEEEDVLAPPTEEELEELQQVRERKQAMKLKRKQKREECDACGKVVYQTERMQVDDLLLHKNCFRCEVCNSKLSLGTFASVNGKLYCNKDFHAMFSSGGGSYDVFGDAGFKKHTGRATTAKGMQHVQGGSGGSDTNVNKEGAMEQVQLKPTPKREKVEAEESGAGIRVSLKKTPKVEKDASEAPVPIKNQVSLKKTEVVEKKVEHSKLQPVQLKPTQVVSA